MPRGTVSPPAGRDDDPAQQDWLAWCDAAAGEDEEEPDPDGPLGPWEYDLDAIIAECRQVTAEGYLCAVLAAFRSGHLGAHPSNTALTRVMPCLSGSELTATG